MPKGLKQRGFVARVGARIVEARRAAGVTQEQLATRARIDARNFQRIEAGEQNITLETLAKIAEALQVDPSELTLPDHTAAKL